MRRLSVLMLLFVLVGGTPMNANAAAKATLTIHYHYCPYGYVHQEYPTLCSRNLMSNAEIGYATSDGRYVTDVADANGNITYQLDPGKYFISNGAMRNSISDAFQVCTANHPAALYDQTLILMAGDIVTCDYYVVFRPQGESAPPEDSLPPGAGHIRYFGAVQCQEAFIVNVAQVTIFPPGGCSTGIGVRMVVTSGDGTSIGSCVTEAPEGYCALHVFVNSAIVREDVDALPSGFAGYAPQANPILYNNANGRNSVLFVNIPIAALPTVAPANSSITVHGCVCPPGYAGANYFADCHGNLPKYQQMMFLAGTLGGADYLAKPIDAEGNVTFLQLLPEQYHLLLGLPSDTVSTYVACSKTNAPDAKVASNTSSSTGWSSTEIDLGAGQDITCDAYTIPPAA